MAELAWIRDSLRLRRTTINENGSQDGARSAGQSVRQPSRTDDRVKVATRYGG